MEKPARKFEVVAGNPRLELLDSLKDIARGYLDGQFKVDMISDITADEFCFRIAHTDGIVRVGLGSTLQGQFRMYLIQTFPDTFTETNLTTRSIEGTTSLVFDLTDYLNEL